MNLKMETILLLVSVMNAGMKCMAPSEKSCSHTGYIKQTF